MNNSSSQRHQPRRAPPLQSTTASTISVPPSSKTPTIEKGRTMPRDPISRGSYSTFSGQSIGPRTRLSTPLAVGTVQIPSRRGLPARPVQEAHKTGSNLIFDQFLALQIADNGGDIGPTTSHSSVRAPLSRQTLSDDGRPSAVDNLDVALPRLIIHEDRIPVAQFQTSSEFVPTVSVANSQLTNDQVGSSPVTITGSFFPNGSGFYFHKPVMNEFHQHHTPDVLDKMSKHIILGAEYDSSYRDDPPRCHPDTRTHLLEQLQMHIHDTTLTTRIVWLVGPAGVGKSAIMQSLAEIACPLPTLRCATLFFSRPNRRDDPKKVFTTLSYGFAVADPEYRRYMAENLTADPMYLDKSLDEQFKRLFILPFTSGNVGFGSRRWVVVLDGLDECNGRKEQQRIIELICESIRRYAQTAPFIWIIASRPEAHLQASFRLVKDQIIQYRKLEVPIDSEEALRSVEVYLRGKFTRIRYNYSDDVPPAWPSEIDFLILTNSSSGLFIFASTLIDYVGTENPVERLKHVVFLITQSVGNLRKSSNEAKRNPFYALDILYSTVMSDVPLDSLPTTKTILGFYLLGNALRYEHFVAIGLDQNSFIHVCNILGIERHNAYAALRNLHSVLNIPSPDEASRKSVGFLHASFSDFLKDHSRSQSYCVNLDRELTNIWRCFTNLIGLGSPEGPASGIPLSWEPQSAIASDVRRAIQRQAEYASVSILIDHYHDSSCQHGDIKYHVFPDTTEILQVFEQLGSRLFMLVGPNRSKDGIRPLCNWLSGHVPVTFRQQVMLKEYNITQLSELDLDRMFAGLCKRKWAFYYTRDSSRVSEWSSEEFELENLDIVQWSRAKQLALAGKAGWESQDPRLHWWFLANLLAMHDNFGVDCRDIKVMIIRVNQREDCAVIGPLNVKMFGSGPQNSFSRYLHYLALPYVE